MFEIIYFGNKQTVQLSISESFNETLDNFEWIAQVGPNSTLAGDFYSLEIHKLDKIILSMAFSFSDKWRAVKRTYLKGEREAFLEESRRNDYDDSFFEDFIEKLQS